MYYTKRGTAWLCFMEGTNEDHKKVQKVEEKLLAVIDGHFFSRKASTKNKHFCRENRPLWGTYYFCFRLSYSIHIHRIEPGITIHFR